MGFIKTAFQNWLGLTDQRKSIEEITAEIKSPSSTADRVKDRNAEKMREFWTWYTADARKLINYYATQRDVEGKRDYFYARSYLERNKKTHSGIPKSIVDTICNVTGIPSFSANIDGNESENAIEELEARIHEIADFNDFKNIIKQDMRPKTLVIGGGVIIVSNLQGIDGAFDKPVIEFVDQRYCDIETIGNIFTGATVRKYYVHNGKEFIHYEKRTYNLVENTLWNETDEKLVPLDTIPQTTHLEPIIKLDIGMIPCVPVRYKNGNGTFGLSIFEGKVDLFDDYDQTCSQIAELVRKSSIKQYIPGEFIEEDSRGNPITPDTYDTNIIVLKSVLDQNANNKIVVEVPNVTFDQILNVGVQQLIQIMTGVLAPASLGIEVQRNNNAEAMREKEKVTLVTRDDIIDNERVVIEKVLLLALRIYDQMQNKRSVDYDIHVDYPDFSSPTFDQLVATMLPLWSNRAISPEQFVELLHGDTLTDVDKEREIAFLKEQLSVPTDINFFGEDEVQTTTDAISEEQIQETVE